MLSVLIMLGLISVLIIAHEMGHYFVARKCGVRVERFGFGLPFGPTLWSKKIGDTEFCLHALLFGGYVAFPDDNPDSEIPEESTERFENQPVWNRAAIAVAGVTVNAILGWAIMVFVILNWGLPSLKDIDVSIVKALSPSAPAAQAGLDGGELLVAVDGQRLDQVPSDKRTSLVSDTIKQHPGQPVVITVSENGQLRSVSVTPDKTGKIGIQLGVKRHYIPVHNPLIAAKESALFLGNFVEKNFEALGRLVTGKIDPKELGGPIRIVDVGAKMMDAGGIQEGLIMTAIISMILAVMNLLPVPALDGGHLLFILIEAIKGKPVKKEVQERFIQAGFVALLALMAFVLWNDINNTWLSPTQISK